MRAFLFQLLILVPCHGFEHFEARHLHPVEVTPDGGRLLAVNALEGRLSVFTATARPVLVAEVPVGLEPVTVRARTAAEAWVVNELSDSVSIVDLVAGAVVATLEVPDEPGDVVFAGGRAFVSCGRNNRIVVFDAVTRARLAEIPVEGVFPRALAVSADGGRIFAGFLLSGNKTTTLHFREAPPQPAPWDASLPEPPQVGLIVPDRDPRIPYEVTDHDVVEIDTASLAVVGYHGGLATNVLGLAMGPDGALWTCGSEARNLIRYEPNLNGVFAESRVTIGAEVVDLNPAAIAPVVAADVKDAALAQPMALLRDATAGTMWVAAFGSDRLAEMDAAGRILRRVDLRSVGGGNIVRGPRGMAMAAGAGWIFVYNKLSGTVTTVRLADGAVVSEVAVASHDPMPAEQRRGRGFFYDARRSGNGTVSCGACHFDADVDGVAWDLGDPAGAMVTVTGHAPSIGEPGPVDRVMHPMKGPMVTQPLRGIRGTGPLHWRGDKGRIQDFNGTFPNLQAGEPLAAEDMDAVAAYLESLRSHPNPNRMTDNSLPASLNGGNPAQGRIRFEQLQVCSKCHEGPRGTNDVLDDFNSVLTRQPVKNATLEHVYKKVFFTPGEAKSLSGYGFTHDGTGRNFPRGHEYDQDRFHLYPNAEADVMAYILCTETDTSPAVGVTSATRPTVLETQAAEGRCEVIARAKMGGVWRSFLYDAASGRYVPDRGDEEAMTAEEILTQGTAVQFSGVAPGQGAVLSIDRDGDGVLNRDTPAPVLTVDAALLPVATPVCGDWFIESSRDLLGWEIYPDSPAPSVSPASSPAAAASAFPTRFFRLHRTW